MKALYTIGLIALAASGIALMLSGNMIIGILFIFLCLFLA